MIASRNAAVDGLAHFANPDGLLDKAPKIEHRA
jgi:hypothetical protein